MSLYDSLLQPWLITPSGFQRLQREAAKSEAITTKAQTVDLVVEKPRPVSAMDTVGIYHIHICGLIGHRLTWLEKLMGNTDVCDVRRELDDAEAQGANGILLHIDSQGGGVPGTVELADILAETTVPIFAYSDSSADSAAYWIACGAQQIWCSGSAEIGSIGVLVPWVDKSVAWASAGLFFEPITNADAIYKSAGHGPSLTDDQRLQVQDRVERIYSMFQQFVMLRRLNIDTESMRGQCFVGYDARTYGLVDFIGSLEQAYGALLQTCGLFPLNLDIEHSVPIEFPQSDSD